MEERCGKAVLAVLVLFLASSYVANGDSCDGIFQLQTQDGDTLIEIDSANGTCNFSTPCDITAPSIVVPQGDLWAMIQANAESISTLQSQIAALQSTVNDINANMVTGVTAQYGEFTLDKSGNKTATTVTMRPGLGLTFILSLLGVFPSPTKRSTDIATRGASEPFIALVDIFAGNFAPTSYSTCDGQLLSITENEVLYQLIGTIFGGDGVNNFALPDLRGRVPLGTGAVGGVGDTIELGEVI